MITYNDDFEPPAPVLPITIAGVVRSSPRIDTIALIDTGSDITAIPSELADGLQLYPFSRVQLEDVSAKKTPALTYAVRLTIANLPMQEVEVILTRLPFAVLGRDLLNEFYLHFEGPEQQFQISATPFDKLNR